MTANWNPPTRDPYVDRTERPHLGVEHFVKSFYISEATVMRAQAAKRAEALDAHRALRHQLQAQLAQEAQP